jgi:hypothetical protein
MTFWDFAAAHPVWMTVWLVIVVAAIPSFNFSYRRGQEAPKE